MSQGFGSRAFDKGTTNRARSIVQRDQKLNWKLFSDDIVSLQYEMCLAVSAAPSEHSWVGLVLLMEVDPRVGRPAVKDMNFAAIVGSGGDRAVQKTDDDAAGSKLSAVLRGYYEDEWLPKLYAKPPVFRLPLINIGTYCRVQGINREIAKFLDTTKDAPLRSIVSLGAGSDSRAFHLLNQYSNLEYYELDFEVKTSQKQRAIDAHAPLKQIQEAGRYHLLAADLRQIDAVDLSFGGQLVLLISECCLCYLPLKESDAVLRYFASKCEKLAVAIYEPMSLHDEFGRVMAENMAQRGLVIPTLEHYADLAAQRQRLLDNALLTTAHAVDINTVFAEWLTPEDRQRIRRLEFLDEVEEMQLLLKHYCIAWGERNI